MGQLARVLQDHVITLLVQGRALGLLHGEEGVLVAQEAQSVLDEAECEMMRDGEMSAEVVEDLKRAYRALKTLLGR